MSEKKEEALCCGLVMPISPIDGCSMQHWEEVKGILTDAVEGAGLQANLVSHADDAGIIQKRIIQNLYENPIVVCDVSCKNPNVMFELGMRLAFDKPTIIIKDDETSYSFDTSPIEHLEYPRDLRFPKIVEFKAALTAKIQATLEKSKNDPNYTTFLKHFGTFTVATIDTKVLSKEDFIIEELKELKKAIISSSSIKTHVRVSEKRTLAYNWEAIHSLKLIISKILESYSPQEPLQGNKKKCAAFRAKILDQVLLDKSLPSLYSDHDTLLSDFHGVFESLTSRTGQLDPADSE